MNKTIDEIDFYVPGNKIEHSIGNKYIKDKLKYEAIGLLSQLNEDLEPLPRLHTLGSSPKENTYELDILPSPVTEDDLNLIRTALINFVKSYFNIKFCSICDRNRNLESMNATHNDDEHECFYEILGDN